MSDDEDDRQDIDFQGQQAVEVDQSDDQQINQDPKTRKRMLEQLKVEDVFDIQNVIDILPSSKDSLMNLYANVKSKITQYQLKFLAEAAVQNRQSFVKNTCVPICADVTKFDFLKLIQTQLAEGGRQFDVIMMDPPWKLSSSKPSRGVAIQYDSLSDEAIQHIPVPLLQKVGFLFVWVINAKYEFTVNLMRKKWGYQVVDQINWVKKTVNGNIAKGHGFYLQHGKQTCLVGFKGPFDRFNKSIRSDVIFSQRRGQSQKPTQIYDYIEQLVPSGFYLQIFGRRNNIRSKWVTIGNQI